MKEIEEIDILTIEQLAIDRPEKILGSRVRVIFLGVLPAGTPQGSPQVGIPDQNAEVIEEILRRG
jgi:hypothetical protein